MIIEISKDIDNYKETVALGLTARQLIFSVLSVAVGAGIILLLYGFIGLTASVYVALPIVAPIALGGFYTFNGMSFYEVMKRKINIIFMNRPLVYGSTECEDTIRQHRAEQDAEVTKGRKSMKSKKGRGD